MKNHTFFAYANFYKNDIHLFQFWNTHIYHWKYTNDVSLCLTKYSFIKYNDSLLKYVHVIHFVKVTLIIANIQIMDDNFWQTNLSIDIMTVHYNGMHVMQFWNSDINIASIEVIYRYVWKTVQFLNMITVYSNGIHMLHFWNRDIDHWKYTNDGSLCFDKIIFE